MRHSFLPFAEQKILKRGYRVHAAVVVLFLMSVGGIIGIGGLFPAYIHVYTEEGDQMAKLALVKQKADNQGIAMLQLELHADATLVNALAKLGNDVRPSDLIQEVASARGSVVITSVSLTEISTTTARMVIQGIAPTRDSLVSFKTRLENLSIGNKVELPISELAKSKDISFSLRFTRIQP